MEEDWEEGTGKYLAVVVSVLFAAPAPVSAPRGERKVLGWESPTKDTKGCHSVG